MKYLLQNYPGSASGSVRAALCGRAAGDRGGVPRAPAVARDRRRRAAAAGRDRDDRARQNGETLLTDGPFVDAKEHVGGFFVVEVDDLDAALEIAARIPAARMGGAVEVRPLVER